MITLLRKIFGISTREMKENQELVAQTAQAHWTYPMAIDILIKEKYDANPKDPNNFNYIVFLDKEGDVDWEYNGIGNRENLDAESTSVISKAMTFEGMSCDLLSKGERIIFKKMIAESIVQAMERNYNKAKELLNAARSFYNGRIVEQSRKWSTIAIFLVGILMGAGLLWLGDFKLSSIAKIYLPMTFGMLGAFVGHFRCIALACSDSDAGCLMRVLNVIGHLSCGIVLGLVGVVFFKSNFCPEGMRGLSQTTEGCVVIAFTAGLFESFIPSLLSKFVAQNDEKENAK